MFWNLLMVVTFTILVLLMTTLFTMCGPYQPPQKGLPMKPTGPHHGSTGSPNPSATHPRAGTGMPMPTFTDTPTGPTKPTSAGAYTAGATTGPGAQPQVPSRSTQRP